MPLSHDTTRARPLLPSYYSAHLVVGLIIALGSGAILLIARRRAGLTLPQQGRAIPEPYRGREVFPVPNWAWAVAAALVFTPYVLGQVHVLSEDHAGTWLLLAFVVGALLLYASGRHERDRRRTTYS